MKWKWMRNHLKWNHFYIEFILQLIRSECVTVFVTVLMEGAGDACGTSWCRVVILFFFFSQITTGTLHRLPPHHPTCILLHSRVRPALTFPSISRPVHPTASFWKTWATLTSFAWSSNVRCIRCIWVMLCVCIRVISLYVCLSYSLFHPNSLSSVMRCLIQHSVR